MPARGGAGRRGRGNRLAWMVTLAMVPLALALLPTALLVFFGMLPTLVALVVDRDPDKYASITVGSLNACGTAPAVINLWQGGHTLDRAVDLLFEPFALLPMFTAAGIGWIVYFAMPPIVSCIVAFRAEAEIKRLKQRQETLIEEWGEAVTAPDKA